MPASEFISVAVGPMKFYDSQALIFHKQIIRASEYGIELPPDLR
jgi:hypothetical protein